MLVGLKDSVYSVGIEPAGDAFQDTTLKNIEVTAGETTDLGTIELNVNNGTGAIE